MTNEKRINHQFDLVNNHDDIIPMKKIETFENKALNQFYDDWLQFDQELRIFEMKHKIYVTKLDDVESLKKQYRNQFNKYQKKIVQLKENIEQLKKSSVKKG
jgi:hypothetical protein